MSVEDLQTAVFEWEVLFYRHNTTKIFQILCIVYIHVYFLALIHPCLCWCMTAYLGTLQPPVDQWNDVKPLPRVYVVPPTRDV